MRREVGAVEGFFQDVQGRFPVAVPVFYRANEIRISLRKTNKQKLKLQAWKPEFQTPSDAEKFQVKNSRATYVHLKAKKSRTFFTKTRTRLRRT